MKEGMWLSSGTLELESGTHDIEGGGWGARKGSPSSRPWSMGTQETPGSASRPRGLSPFLTLAGSHLAKAGRVCHFPQSRVGRSEAKVGVGQGKAFGQGGLLCPPYPQPGRRPGPGTRKGSFCGKREKVNFRFLILRAADAQWLASYPPTCSSSRCLSSVNPGSLPPQGPYSSPLLSSAAHTHTYSPAPGPPQATCAQRRSRKPAATKGLMPEAERRLRACWELRALLGSVVPHAGGKASTGWSPRVGGWGVGKASVSHLAGRWRKNLVPAARRQRVPGSGLRSWVPADSDCEKPRG